VSADFRILFHKTENSLHLKLLGTLDGNSALELLNTLNLKTFGASRVFIHTAGLKEIDPSGQSLFRSHFNDLKARVASFLFTGEKAFELAPEGNGAVGIVP
jgi:ABC-type transporter Mla MlaB component